MKLKPQRFIGYRIGPFEEVELNWHKNSHYTLILGENGAGKTTLIAAMAACLALNNDVLFPAHRIEQFAHDETSFAYFEVSIANKPTWFFWGNFDSLLKKAARISPDFSKKLATGKDLPQVQWHKAKTFTYLCAAYGVNRNLQHVNTNEFKVLNSPPLKNILNPFAQIDSGDIFQWLANQYIQHALALVDNHPEEAQDYLQPIQQVEQVWQDILGNRISFQLKRNPFRLEVQQNNIVLPIDQLSSGTRSFLSWTLDYLMRASRISWDNPKECMTAPGLVMIDELDLHLHPEWQRRITAGVTFLLPQTYIIATTHSPFILGATDKAQIFQIYKDGDGRLKVKDHQDQLYGYPADIILEKLFVSSLYPPTVEAKLLIFNQLTQRVASGEISPEEKQYHTELLEELATVSPWLKNLLALTQIAEQQQPKKNNSQLK